MNKLTSGILIIVSSFILQSCSFGLKYVNRSEASDSSWQELGVTPSSDVQNPSTADDKSEQLPQLSNDDISSNKLISNGINEFNNKHYEIALAYFKEALKTSNTASLYKKIGNCNYYLGNKKEAINAYQKSLSLNPSDTTLKQWLDSYSNN